MRMELYQVISLSFLLCYGSTDYHHHVPETLATPSKPKFSRPLQYYSNCSSTFQIDLLFCGDIHPHPGPTNSDSQRDTTPLADLQKLKGIKILSQNIDSLFAKIDQLRLMVYETKPDVLAIMETKINDTVCSSELAISGYDLHRRDRSRNGGGVAVYLNNQLPYSMLDPSLPPSSETLWVKISLPCTRPVLLGVVYRSQIEKDFNKTFSNILHELLEPLNQGRNPCEIVCIGDFNHDQFKTNSSDWKEFEQTMSNFRMKQMITKPTRVTINSSTCIDHVWTNRPQMYGNNGVVVTTFSDHRMIFTGRKGVRPKRESKIIEARSFRKFDESAFVDDLSAVDWSDVCEADTPDQGWDLFLGLFLPVCNKHAPVKKIKVSSQQPRWINEEYLDLRRQSQKAREIAERTKSDANGKENWAKSKALRNKVNNLCKQLKADYLDEQINENKCDASGLWKTLKTVLPGKSNHDIQAIATESGLTNDKQKVADTINEFFSTIGENLAKKFESNHEYQNESLVDVKNCFKFTTICEDQVFKILQSLDSKKATGLDGVSSRLLKAGATPLASPLTKLFNLSLSSGQVPQQWKTARVTPLFKEGSKTDANNYRPISVLPVVMKIFERLIHNQLYSFLSQNNLLSSNQSGFRPGHSTQTTLIEVSDYILKNIDKGKVVGGVFIDLKKAFDTVNHSILLGKLKSFGILGLELDWFTSYLDNRMQATKVGNVVSNFATVKFGVPQGSILGPLLFTIFINDLPLVVSNRTKINLYADDTAIFYASKDIQEINAYLNIDLAGIDLWMERNNLTLNAKKTQAILFCSIHKVKKTNDLELYLKESRLENVNQCKYLGLIFDQTLKWDAHINQICRNVSKYIGLFYRIREWLSADHLNTIYKALVLPRLSYCDVVWGNCNLALQDKMERLQNRAGRAILKVPVRTSSSLVRDKLGWIELADRRHNNLCITVFKCLADLVPKSLKNTFSLVRDSHDYKTRGSSHGNISLDSFDPKSGAFKRSFLFRGAVAWNSLSTALKSPLPPSVAVFKRKLLK